MQFHLADVNIVIAGVLRTLNLGKLVGNHITYVHNPRGLDLGNEVRVSIFKNVYVEVQFEESVERVAVSDNDLLGANFVFVFRINVDRIVRLVVGGDVSGASAILVHYLGICIHHCHDEALCVLGGNVVLKGDITLIR